MKINGIEIEELATTELLKHLKIFTVLIPFYFIFGGGFGLLGVGLALNLPGEEMWMVPVMGIVGGIIFFSVGISLLKKVRYIKKVLATRTISEVEQASADSIVKKILITSVLLIIIIPIILISVIGGSVDGSSSRCVSCGERGIYSESGYCYSCYQEVYDRIEENGR